MSILAWKLLHVASVILFLGNIITGLFWAAHAQRTRDFRIIAHAFDGIRHSDRLFTLPGVAGVLIFGIGAAAAGNWPLLSTGWIFWSMILFLASGLAFMFRVAPLQRRIADFAREAPATEESRKTHDAMYRRWLAWGHAALVTPVAAAALMILKPSLPGI